MEEDKTIYHGLIPFTPRRARLRRIAENSLSHVFNHGDYLEEFYSDSKYLVTHEAGAPILKEWDSLTGKYWPVTTRNFKSKIEMLEFIGERIIEKRDD